MKSLRLGIAVAVAALLLATVVAMAAGITRFDRVLIRDLIVTGESTLDTATATDLTTDANVTAGTYLQSTSYTKVGSLLILDAATSVTVTNGAAFAIAGAWQPITAAGAVTPTITIPAAGVNACIVNNSAQTINIADSGNVVLTAAFAMGQYDVLCGHSDGTRFLEISRANN